MVNNEYEKFYGQTVGVITTGRAADIINNKTNHSLTIEGILNKETESQIYLSNAESPDINSDYCAISKDKIISLYLIGSWKVKKVPKTEKSDEPELILKAPEQQPKPA